MLCKHQGAIALSIADMKGINPSFCTQKQKVQPQMRLNPNMMEVIKKEVNKHLDARIKNPILDYPWVSPTQVVPKKRGMTVVSNEYNELILICKVIGCHVCIYFRKLNDATWKDHFPLPFIDQMLERLAGNNYYFFFMGYLDTCRFQWHWKISKRPLLLAYRRMPSGRCNGPTTF